MRKNLFLHSAEAGGNSFSILHCRLKLKIYFARLLNFTKRMKRILLIHAGISNLFCWTA
jgi:hypothetical protein